MSPENKNQPNDDIKVVANNRSAFHEYFILESLEAGVELTGTEVKSIRDGKINIRDGYVRINGLQAFLENVHIQPYEGGNRQNHEPLRTRRLLMHRGEIVGLFSSTREKGLTIVPLRIYFRRGRAKVEIGLVKGKKSWDKRQTIAERDAKREMDRAVRHSVR